MSFDETLKGLAKEYMKFGMPSDEQRFTLEANLIALLNKELCSQGRETQSIESRYRKLSIKFHTDRIAQMGEEVLWLDAALSLQGHQGACFHILSSCKAALIAENEKVVEEEMKETTTFTKPEDFQDWCQRKEAEAELWSQKFLYRSLAGFYKERIKHLDDVSKLNNDYLKFLLLAFPLMIGGSAAFVFAKEITAIYTASMLINLLNKKYGGNLGDNPIFQLLCSTGYYSFIFATAALGTGLKASYLFTNRTMLLSMKLGKAMMSYWSTPSLSHSGSSMDESQDDWDIRTVRELLEKYQLRVQGQWFSYWRQGGQKANRFSLALKKIDSLQDCSQNEKRDQILKLLQELKENPGVYQSGKHAKRAIDAAFYVLGTAEWLKIEEEQVALTWEAPPLT